MADINIFLAFLAGVLSIFSPCILPVLPSFIGYITGVSLQKSEKNENHKSLQYMLWQTFLFSIGFLITFLIFGTVMGALGAFLVTNQILLQRIGGVIIIVFGLQMLGVFKLSFMASTHRFGLHNKSVGSWHSFLTGIIFAFSWSPCYGPILGGILTLAATSGQAMTGFLMFLFYSIGFLIPLFIFTIAIYRGSNLIRKNRKLLPYINIFSGLLLVLIGFFLVSNLMINLVNWLDGIYIATGLNQLS